MYQKLNTLWQTHRADILDSLRLFERQVLLFPVLVVLSVAITFLFGGHITAAHWWLPTLAILTYPYFTPSPTKAKYLTTTAFLSLLLGIWLYAGTTATMSGVDNVVYHLPGTQLLIEGWNPVYAPTPERLAESMAIDPWETRLWHTLFTAKAVWIFNACAYFFTQTPFNLLFPLLPFLLIGTLGQVWRLLRTIPNPLRILTLTLIALQSPSAILITDATVTLAGIGLLAVMGRAYNKESNIILPLIIMSFWMMNAKLPGLLSCFIFWCCFATLLLWRNWRSAIPQLSTFGAILIGLFLLVSANPYLTAWKHYSHPLYPAYSADEEKYPVYDITKDFNMANEDAEAMGHLGALVNTYISPTLAQTYYKWKLKQETFAPNRYVWWQTSKDRFEAVTPLNLDDRLYFLGIITVLLLLSHGAFRFIAITMLIGVYCIPTPYLGFPRYIPWNIFIDILAVTLLLAKIYQWQQRGKHILRFAILCGITLFLTKELVTLAFQNALTIDAYATFLQEINDNPPKAIYGNVYDGEIAELYAAGKHIAKYESTFGDPAKTTLINLRLLCKKVPQLHKTEVHPVSCTQVNQYPLMPLISCARLAPGTQLLNESECTKINKLPNRKERLLRYPILILKSYTILLPKLIIYRLQNHAPKESL